MTGRVKIYDGKKGFGIINSNNRDYFFRYTDIVGRAHRHCFEGETVSFVPQEHVRGLRAVEVRAV